MVKMREKTDKDGNKVFEFERETAEIIEIYLARAHVIAGESEPPVPIRPTRRAWITQALQKLEKTDAPSSEDLVDFILSKPNYAHDIIEVQKHFLGTRISSPIFLPRPRFSRRPCFVYNRFRPFLLESQVY